MRVIHWYPHLLGGGGVAHAVLRVANAQAALGAEVLVAHKFAPEGKLPGAPDPRLRFEAWRQRGGTFIARIVRPGPAVGGFAQLLAFAPDVIHVHGEFNPDNLCIPMRFRCPIVLSPHGCFHPGVFDKRYSGLKRLYFGLARRLLYRHASFHAASPLEAEHITQLLPNQAVRCAPLAPAFEPRALARTRPEGGRIVKLVFVGRLDVYTKGLDLLLDAFARASSTCSPLRLTLDLLGGDQGGGMRFLAERARALGVMGRVRFLGHQPADVVARALADADLYVQLSRHEGFGLSVVEALCAGLPALITDEMGVASFPEVARSSHVRVVPPRVDAAAVAIVDIARRRAQARAEAQARVDEFKRFFSWENAARLLLDHYDGAVVGVARSLATMAPPAARVLEI